MRNKMLILIGVISFIFGLIGVNYFIYNNKNNSEIPKVKLKEQENKKGSYALMIQQNDGTYRESASTTFEQPGYIFNSEKSICIDIDGNKIENALKYNETTKLMEVNTGSTTYCYVYFDKMPADANELITTLASASEIAYDGTTDNNLRYIGANPNNYVYFNCNDYNNPTADTCEKWRIIGAFNNMKTSSGETKTLLKIIRDDSLGTYYWDYKQSGVGSSSHDNGSNDWTDSQLMLMLNGVTLGNYKSGYRVCGDYLCDTNEILIMNINGSYYEGSSRTHTPTQTSTSGYSNYTTIDFSNSGLKNDTTRGIIENVVWKLGGARIVTDNTNGLVSHWYGYERGTDVWSGRPTEWTGKIGLMYPSDYGYATGGGSTTSRETCLATYLWHWDSSISPSFSDCKNNDWLYMMGSQYTLTPHPNPLNEFIISSSGGVTMSDVSTNYLVRPTVYLASNIRINGGNGSSESPYTIKL